MALQDKYQELINAAMAADVAGLQVREQDNVLYIDGIAPTGAVKDNLWSIYEKLDPNFTGGDLILNINVNVSAATTKAKVITDSSNLNIRKGPGTDQPIVGKAAHGETITLVSQPNEQWWLVRTNDGEEGYAYSRYLEAQP